MSELLDRLHKNLAAMGQAPAPVVPHVFDYDLIPDVGPSTHEPDDLDALLGGVGVLDAYQRWCGKMVPQPGNRRESVMVSCPIPGHEDKHPSAWLNLDKNVWHCGPCGQGGDVYDIAAWHFGFNVPGYKRDGFPALRVAMAEDLGYTVKKTIGGQEYVSAPEPTPAQAPEPVAPVVQLFATPPRTEEPVINWRAILPEDTFLRRWMDECSKDDLPEEYYFWLGLMAVAAAAGGDVTFRDNPPVKGNLFVCLYGPSGIGKTRASKALMDLLDRALPFDWDDPHSTGMHQVPVPGSAETLVDSFSKPEYDPTDPKKILRYNPVRGIVRFDEFADLIGRAGRNGNLLKEYLIQFYDSYNQVSIKSRGSGLVKAEGHFMEVLSTTQPRSIRDLLVANDAASGFANRWIFAAGRLKPLVPIGRKPLDIESLVQPLRQLRTWCSPRTLEMDAAAEAVWIPFFRAEMEPTRLASDGNSLLIRCDLTMKKLILLLAVDRNEKVISASTVERALLLWPYLQQTYGMLAGQIGQGPFNDCCNQILEIVARSQEQTGRPPSAFEISGTTGFNHPKDMVLKALSTLVILGHLNEIAPPKQRGRPTTRYELAS